MRRPKMSHLYTDSNSVTRTKPERKQSWQEGSAIARAYSSGLGRSLQRGAEAQPWSDELLLKLKAF